jgi:hypothetical protein
MNEPIKFCKDCKHFKHETYGVSKCNRPADISLVYGTPLFRGTSAASERTLDHTGCGTQAKYFELKEEV